MNLCHFSCNLDLRKMEKSWWRWRWCRLWGGSECCGGVPPKPADILRFYARWAIVNGQGFRRSTVDRTARFFLNSLWFGSFIRKCIAYGISWYIHGNLRDVIRSAPKKDGNLPGNHHQLQADWLPIRSLRATCCMWGQCLWTARWAMRFSVRPESALDRGVYPKRDVSSE